MNEDDFKKKLIELGYEGPELREFEPGPPKEMRTHDRSVMMLVLRGDNKLTIFSGFHPRSFKS